MKLAALFSGGKDSTYAMWKAMEGNEIACLITVFSENKESYMFHTPNIWLARLQAEAIGIPLLEKATKGEKEAELADLEEAIKAAVKQYGVEGIVTGAVGSVYQSERIQKICGRLGLACINPLWQREQVQLLKEIVGSGFKIIISGVFAYPLDKKWLGREIDAKAIAELEKLKEKYKISPMGEGGELETTVLDAPVFKNRLEIIEAETVFEEDSGVFVIKKARLVGK